MLVLLHTAINLSINSFLSLHPSAAPDSFSLLSAYIWKAYTAERLQSLQHTVLFINKSMAISCVTFSIVYFVIFQLLIMMHLLWFCRGVLPLILKIKSV